MAMVETMDQKSMKQALAPGFFVWRIRLAGERLRNMTSTLRQYWENPEPGNQDSTPPRLRLPDAETGAPEKTPDRGKVRHLMTSQSTMETGRQRHPFPQGHPPLSEGGTSLQGDWRECDSRHRNIIGRLDGMIELLRQHPGRNLTAEMDHLLDVMLNQVCPENSYLELVAFPQAAEHSRRHRIICSIAAKQRYRFSRGCAAQVPELEYLRLIWLEHIQLHDGAFEKFLGQ